MRKSKSKGLNGSFNVKIYVDDKKYWNGVFQTADVTGSNDEQNRGWVLQLKNNVDGDLAKCLLNLGGDKWLLPFRQTTKNFNWVNPALQGKWIETTVSVSATQSHKVVVQFEYKVFGAVINEKGLTTLCNNLNRKRNEKLNHIKELKSQANDHANSYATNKQSFEAVSQGAGLDKQIAKLKQDNNDLNKKQFTLLSQMNENKAKIAESDIKVSNLKNEQNNVIAIQSSIANTIEETNKSIAALNKQKESGTISADGFKADMEKALAGFNEKIAKLLVEVSSSKDLINSAKTSLIEKNDLKGCTTAISKIYP
jgi:predicted  nucleic acid-binding Zn-ribbon protein